MDVKKYLHLVKVTHNDNSLVPKVDAEDIPMPPSQFIKGLNRRQSVVPGEGENPEDGQRQEGARRHSAGYSEPQVNEHQAHQDQSGGQHLGHIFWLYCFETRKDVSPPPRAADKSAIGASAESTLL